MKKLATITAVSVALALAALTAPASDAAARSRISATVSKTMPAVSLRGVLKLSQRKRYRLRLPRRSYGTRRPVIKRRSFAPGGARILPLSVIAPRVLARVPGQLRGGHLIGRHYLIKILSRSGRLVYVYADARTGQIARIRR